MCTITIASEVTSIATFLVRRSPVAAMDSHSRSGKSGIQPMYCNLAQVFTLSIVFSVEPGPRLVESGQTFWCFSDWFWRITRNVPTYAFTLNHCPYNAERRRYGLRTHSAGNHPSLKCLSNVNARY